MASYNLELLFLEGSPCAEVKLEAIHDFSNPPQPLFYNVKFYNVVIMTFMCTINH